MVYLAARMVRIGFGAPAPRGSTSAIATCWSWSACVRAHGVPARPEQPGLQRDRRRLRRRGRRVAADCTAICPTDTCPTAAATPCGGRYYNGDPIGYIQTDGRCESPIESGDTYGPTVYLAYVPAVAALGWSGIWDRLPSAHVAASAFDILAVVGLFVAGWRLGSRRLGVALAFALGRQPVHALLAEHELERRARGRPAGVDAGRCCRSRPRAARCSRRRASPSSRRLRWCRCSRRCATGSRRSSAFAVAALLLLAMLALDRARAVALLAPHDRLPARPGDADVDLDAGRLTTRAGGTCGCSSTCVQVAAGLGVVCLWRCSPATARTPPPWPRSPGRS